jgi:hypothetical protein
MTAGRVSTQLWRGCIITRFDLVRYLAGVVTEQR